MSKATNRFSPEAREQAVRLVLDNERQHRSLWQAVMSIAAQIGCQRHHRGDAGDFLVGWDLDKQLGAHTPVSKQPRPFSARPIRKTKLSAGLVTPRMRQSRNWDVAANGTLRSVIRL